MTISEWCAEVASEGAVEGVRGPGCLGRLGGGGVSSLKVMDGGWWYPCDEWDRWASKKTSTSALVEESSLLS